MAGDPNFKYDVAFSFLDQDEPLARELADLLTPLTTFVYSEQQLAVAATDGVDTFSKVFRRDARIVVILYRAGVSFPDRLTVKGRLLRVRSGHAEVEVQ